MKINKEKLEEVIVGSILLLAYVAFWVWLFA
jgi:hypothetical protein